MGRYDFTRFTFLGHRRLFRHFTQVKAGMALGPAGALAWSLEYFCLSFFSRSATRKYVRVAVKLATAPIKYFDRILARREGALTPPAVSTSSEPRPTGRSPTASC